MTALLAAHCPVLIVVLPLAAAALNVLLGRGMLPWLFASTVAWADFGLALMLAARVRTETVVSYALGGFPPPIGIEYQIDALSALVVLLVTGVAAVVFTASRASIEAEIETRNRGLVYTMLLLALSGFVGVSVTGDAFNAFVWLEIMSLSSYVLVALGGNRDRRALSAAYNYLVMGTIGATFYVIGLGFAYMMTGTLNMADLAARIPWIAESRTVAVAFGFIVVGVALKLALFPLHLWLPNAYAYAPSVVSTFLAATSTKVAVYLLLRFLFTVFGLQFGFEAFTLQAIFLPLAVIGIVTASFVALFQDDVKRLLAYSSLAQIGYMILGIGLASTAGVRATVLHIFNHGLMKGALFMATSAVALRVGATTLPAFAGLGRRMPLTMAGFVGGAVSLVGMPLTVGFTSKWYLVLAALDQGQWWVALLVAGASLVALAYVWRVIEAAYFRVPETSAPRCEAPPLLLAGLWLLVLANIYLGINAHLTTALADRAAHMLIGEEP
jgi:multicomponent Na+:H+ antiporter subunit D